MTTKEELDNWAVKAEKILKDNGYLDKYSKKYDPLPSESKMEYRDSYFMWKVIIIYTIVLLLVGGIGYMAWNDKFRSVINQVITPQTNVTVNSNTYPTFNANVTPVINNNYNFTIVNKIGNNSV